MPMKTVRNCLAASLVLVAAACDSPSGEERAGPPARLDIVSGNQQTVTVGTELPDPLVVRVVDDKGKPVEGQLVNFRPNGGTVFAGSALTNQDGEARERWTLGTTAGTQTVEARAVDPATGAAVVFGTFTAVATPGPPAIMDADSGGTHEDTVGTTLAAPRVVRVRDAFSNITPGVQVTFTPSRGSVNPVSAVTNEHGRARTTWTLGTVTGNDSLVATAGAARTRFDGRTKPGQPVGLLIEPEGQLAMGQNSTVDIRVTTLDRYGNEAGTVDEELTVTSSNPNVARAERYTLTFVKVRSFAAGTTVLNFTTPTGKTGTLTVIVS